MKFSSFLDKVTYFSVLIFLASLTWSTALMEIMSVTMLIGWGFLKSKNGWKLEIDKRVFYFLAAYVFLSTISFFWSEFPKQSFRGVFKILQHFFLFWIVAETLKTPERHRTASKILIYSFIILGVDGIWQYVFGKDLLRQIACEPASSGPRISATFKNYGLLASYLISFLPLLGALFKRGDERKKNWAVVTGVFLGLLLLFWTRLRGAWVAFLGGLFFGLWNRKKRVYVLFALLAICAVPFVLPRSMIIHLDSEGKEQSLVERYYLWDRALQVIEARPLTGTGINTYDVAHQKYDQRQNWRVRGYYAHNGYLQMAAETGLPSLFCFLGFIFFYFWRAFEILRKSTNANENCILLGFLTGMTSFLILGSIDTTLHNPHAVMAFWFLAAWGMAYLQVLKKP